MHASRHRIFFVRILADILRSGLGRCRCGDLARRFEVVLFGNPGLLEQRLQGHMQQGGDARP
jgi:hypothetical protein